MNIEPFLEWIRERELIRIRREQGTPAPWTDNPILQQFRFCNVRREDDRVTIWVRERIRKPYADHSNLWFMLCIARFINWPPTLQAIMDAGAWPVEEYQPERVVSVLDELSALPETKVWTGAYLIKGDSDMAKPASYRRKPFYVGKTVLGETWHRRHAVAAWLPYGIQATHKVLSGIYGWGPFLSYQVAVDMKYCPRLFAGASDVDKWAASGPGTLRGLNRLHERRVDAPLSQEEALTEMLEIYPALSAAFDDVHTLGGPGIDLSDVPNIMCEVDKMLRVRNNEGRPKALYRSQGNDY